MGAHPGVLFGRSSVRSLAYRSHQRALVAIVTKCRRHASKHVSMRRRFRLIFECRNSPRMAHNTFKKLPACIGMSRCRVSRFRICRARGGIGERQIAIKRPFNQGWGVVVRSELPVRACRRTIGNLGSHSSRGNLSSPPCAARSGAAAQPSVRERGCALFLLSRSWCSV